MQAGERSRRGFDWRRWELARGFSVQIILRLRRGSVGQILSGKHDNVGDLAARRSGQRTLREESDSRAIRVGRHPLTVRAAYYDAIGTEPRQVGSEPRRQLVQNRGGVVLIACELEGLLLRRSVPCPNADHNPCRRPPPAWQVDTDSNRSHDTKVAFRTWSLRSARLSAVDTRCSVRSGAAHTARYTEFAITT